jgi:hypothetical protein
MVNHCRWLVAGLIIFACVAPLHGRDSKKGKDGKDDVVGAIWKYTLTLDEKEETGQFRVFEDEIFKGPDKVGKVESKDNDETTLIFKKWPEMNGRATLRKIKNGRAAGTLIKKDGSKWKMVATWQDG